jgi:hypothetical protein
LKLLFTFPYGVELDLSHRFVSRMQFLARFLVNPLTGLLDLSARHADGLGGAISSICVVASRVLHYWFVVSQGKATRLDGIVFL